MFTLDSVAPTTKKRKRIGRGGSRGGTSGKGHKGQKARSGGKVPIGFEGGQMPLYRRLPKRGFTNARFSVSRYIVDLQKIDALFDENTVVNKESLIEKGLVNFKKSVVKKEAFFVKVLGNKISKSLTVQVEAFSQSARAAIEAAGGKAEVVIASAK